MPPQFEQEILFSVASPCAHCPYSVAPVGEGALAVAGPGMTGYAVAGRFQAVTGAPALDYLSVLADGTLLGGTNRPGVCYLGTGTGMNRTWIRIDVS